MSSIKAVVNIAPGKAEIQEVPYPELSEGYIIVKPTAWAINPDDVYHLDLVGEESCVGTRVGADYAGVVMEIGSDITKDFKKGDRIAGWVLGQYDLADFLAVNEHGTNGSAETFSTRLVVLMQTTSRSKAMPR